MDALVQHIQLEYASLHIPGHQQGRVGWEAFLSFLDRGLMLDLTELPGLDDFHNAKGCIARSQQLAAVAYGSDACLYSVNGSTACVMAALKAVACPGDAVLLAGPFHQSAWRGLVWSGARACLGRTGFASDRQLTLPPTADEVAAWLDAGDAVQAVFLTSPIYQGLAADVQAIARVVHARGLPLIVDEAHGAHFGLVPEFPPHSVAAGADVVIHSVHKTLPGLTQTAWVHVQGPRVDRERLREALLFLHSTSPSYLLLASLDAAQAWREAEGPDSARRTLARLAAFDLLPAEGGDGFRIDPLRQWLPTGDRAASRRLVQELAARGLFPEYADGQGVLSVFGLGVGERTLARYQEAVARWRTDFQPQPDASESGLWQALARAHAVLDVAPAEADSAGCEWVPIAAAVGRLAQRMVTPYPPGVPLILPGQRIGPEHRDLLAAVWGSGYDVQGVTDDGEIAVIC
ncbi:aminotransferase class I/II-fold pyridoxal phosphate-dependent enzyme [Alicyclobacillus shizuokensis]|uniref:aminotransferase class I/II-fold pyridoxal phosphate-dependent enzyme n=1 Tax=Alicyclobacillus shizuokensis TaxID=392014 RepID=UPI000834C0D0|nr:aminotransferase class I/II-fold pyridoxal phosphate-dependent enzyme [Alicyclobacillus shizuokensis]